MMQEMRMSNIQEFIYKGDSQTLVHERSCYMLGKRGDKTPYYLLRLDAELDIGDTVQVSYSCMMPYRNGQLLVGGEV